MGCHFGFSGALVVIFPARFVSPFWGLPRRFPPGKPAKMALTHLGKPARPIPALENLFLESKRP
jgi:hypothetical protein